MKYEQPEIEIMKFCEAENIITTSPPTFPEIDGSETEEW